MGVASKQLTFLVNNDKNGFETPQLKASIQAVYVLYYVNIIFSCWECSYIVL